MLIVLQLNQINVLYIQYQHFCLQKMCVTFSFEIFLQSITFNIITFNKIKCFFVCLSKKVYQNMYGNAMIYIHYVTNNMCNAFVIIIRRPPNKVSYNNLLHQLCLYKNQNT